MLGDKLLYQRYISWVFLRFVGFMLKEEHRKALNYGLKCITAGLPCSLFSSTSNKWLAGCLVLHSIASALGLVQLSNPLVLVLSNSWAMLGQGEVTLWVLCSPSPEGKSSLLLCTRLNLDAAALQATARYKRQTGGDIIPSQHLTECHL